MTERHCNLHHQILLPDSVPIQYGTYAPEPAHVLAERNSAYPFANTIVRGPCWVEDETHATVMYCPACREAWQRTPEGRAQADYLARERPSEEQEIERLRAQEDGNRRDRLILSLAYIVCYVVVIAVVGAAAGYLRGFGLLIGLGIGGVVGLIVGALVVLPSSSFKP